MRLVDVRLLPADSGAAPGPVYGHSSGVLRWMPIIAVGLRQRHVGGDAGAEVAAVGAVALVPEPVHEAVPEPGDVRPVDADPRRARGEPVPGQGRHDQVEPVASRSTSGSSSANVLGQPWVSTSGGHAAPVVDEVHAHPVDSAR